MRTLRCDCMIAVQECGHGNHHTHPCLKNGRSCEAHSHREGGARSTSRIDDGREGASNARASNSITWRRRNRGRGRRWRAALVDLRDPRDRTADDRARHHGGQHRAALGAAGAAFLQQQPGVGRDRVRARVRQPAARRWADRRSVRPQAAVHRQHDRIRRRVGSRRRGAELRDAGGGARAAGRVRRADGTRGAVAGEYDVHRSARARRRRSGSGERSSVPARRSGCCSAACSPRICRGAGRCS